MAPAAARRAVTVTRGGGAADELSINEKITHHTIQMGAEKWEHFRNAQIIRLSGQQIDGCTVITFVLLFQGQTKKKEEKLISLLPAALIH